MRCGCTFLLYDDYGVTPHLHVAITEPDDDGNVVLVSVTTERAKSDTMVRLNVGDHPFIQHTSVITFAYSKVLSAAHVESLITAGEAEEKQQASERLVRRAQLGMLETDRAPEEVKEFFLWWWRQYGPADTE